MVFWGMVLYHFEPRRNGFDDSEPVKTKPWSQPAGGRPVTTNTDQIIENIELDRHVASRDIAQALGVSHQTILNHLQKAGYKKKA